ncbi:MAG: hypothetical protein L3J66_11210 [Bacteroidales bacterium]|nr:hypothetical protein [Bacteroidales bacterium]
MEDDKFKQELDELFRLFKKVMETKPMEDVPGVNKMMLQQFQFFFSNYESMKDQIAYQLQGQFGESVKGMVHTLIQQLREELGDEAGRPEEIPIEEPTKEIAGISVTETLKKIDEKLKDPNLTEDQINELLDQRAMYQ